MTLALIVWGAVALTTVVLLAEEWIHDRRKPTRCHELTDAEWDAEIDAALALTGTPLHAWIEAQQVDAAVDAAEWDWDVVKEWTR